MIVSSRYANVIVNNDFDMSTFKEEEEETNFLGGQDFDDSEEEEVDDDDHDEEEHDEGTIHMKKQCMG
jgi:hypothetical protein